MMSKISDAVDFLQRTCHRASVGAGWWSNKATGLDLRAVVRGEADGEEEKLLGAALVAQNCALGIDLGGAVAEKLAYNETRADHKADARGAVGGKTY